MNWAVILPLVAFVILAVAFAIILRRAGRLVAATRALEGFRSGTRDLVARADRSLGEITGRVDQVRRGQIAAPEINDDLAASLDAVERYAQEARTLKPPLGADRIRDAIAAELDRAGRALQLVEHGTTIMSTGGRIGERELEAKTSIKRGYLNLVHAREAIVRHGGEAVEFEPVEPPPKAVHHRM